MKNLEDSEELLERKINRNKELRQKLYESPNDYFIKLDFVRILACVLVFLYHLGLISGGYLAVCTFFVLTGYLTCVSALKQTNFSLKKYYINRTKRIYIPLLIVIFSTIIIFKIIPDIKWLNLKPESLSALFSYNNYWQLHANFDYFTRHINSPFIHLWYISILIQFEILFPIFFIVFKKLKHTLPLTIFLTLCSSLYFIYSCFTKDIMFVYYDSFTRIFSILFGISLALTYFLFQNKISKKIKKHTNLIFITYCIIFIIICSIASIEKKIFPLWMILATIISTRLVKYSTLKKKYKERPNPFISFFSKLSYEIYLVQFPVIFFMQNLIINNTLKIVLIAFLTIIISSLIYFALKLNKYIKICFLALLIAVGGFFLIIEKDNSMEMKELEQKLNENSKIIEEKNQEIQAGQNASTWQDIDFQIDENQLSAQISNLPITGIGDSVLLGSVDALYSKFPNGYFDGKVSRTINSAKDVVSDLQSKGLLSDILVFNLANNGDYSTELNKEFISMLGDRQIYWINAVGADDPLFNDKFEEFAKDYPNIHIVKWDVASKDHPEYFYADGIHLKGDGPTAYAQTLYDAIYENYLDKIKKEQSERN